MLQNIKMKPLWNYFKATLENEEDVGEIETMDLYGKSIEHNRKNMIKTFPIQAILPGKVESPECGCGVHLSLTPLTSS